MALGGIVYKRGRALGGLMAGLADLLAKLSVDQHLRGRQFEELCLWFFTNDPLFKTQLKRVWLWRDWPGRWGADAGIDVVAETHGGEVWAIQAKAYAPNHSITKRDVDTFLSESARPGFSHRLVIGTTNQIGTTARRTIQAQRGSVGLLLLADLEKSQVDWPRSPGDLRPARVRRKRPFCHNRKAVAEVCDGLERTDRGQLIMACGTGKTLVGLWAAARLRARRTLVLLPSLSLLAQTLREWTANAASPFAVLAVCSDETVAEDDHFVEHTSELGIPVTTEPSEIGAFLRRRGTRVVFATYQSSLRVAEALHSAPRFDLVVADEAHRCAGAAASSFASVLDANVIRAKRRLFMTATPRYFTERIRREGNDLAYEIASMDDHDLFGPVLHRLTFGDAIERGLLSDYQVAIVGVDDDTSRRYAEQAVLVRTDRETKTDARSLAGQVGLAKAMRKYDLRRVISFHSRVRSARAFSASLADTLAWMPPRQRPTGEVWASYVSGEMPSGRRDVLLSRLRHIEEGQRGLLTNARCLGEGVDVPSVDGVAFIDPRRSQVDIVQAVGRAIRRSEEKTVGTVVLPLFIDTTEDAEVALDSSVFKPVWDVLRALRAHDELLGEQLDELRRSLGRRRGRLRLPSKIRIDLPVGLTPEFADAFSVRLVNLTTAPWEFWFGLMEGYVEREGTAKVPVDYKEQGFNLGSWAERQRAIYSDSPSALARGVQLSSSRIARLEALPGWTWHRWDSAWDVNLRLLKQYVEREGHTRIPFTHIEDEQRLGGWASKQRVAHRDGKLSRARIARLEAVPEWTWDARESAWNEGFDALVAFAQAKGHANVPSTYRSAGFALGPWVQYQRSYNSDGTLSKERRRKLEAVPGWTWDPRQAAWEEGFAALCRFVQRVDHAQVPARFREDGFRLGQWVVVQRQRAMRDTLSAEERERLESLPGWSWARHHDRWERSFGTLEAYVAREGHACPPAKHNENGFRLGGWVDVQRQAYKRSDLSSERIERLEGLPGWNWSPKGEAWTEMYDVLCSYVSREGHALVPKAHIEDGVRLGQWVNNQRALYNRGDLSSERTKRLGALAGWQWTTTKARVHR